MIDPVQVAIIQRSLETYIETHNFIAGIMNWPQEEVLERAQKLLETLREIDNGNI